MFTGIIEATAEVLAWDGSSLVLSRPASFDDIKIGSSICVQGVCLSVTKFDKNSLHFSVVPETIRRSTLGSFTKGQRVNLERGMKADSRLDGHIVQGHVEGVGTVLHVSSFHSSIFRGFPLPPAPSPVGGGGEQTFVAKRPIGKILLGFAKMMRTAPTKAEAVLWKALRRHQMLGLVFRRQHPMDGFILDFYCHEVRLAIELDGGIHEDANQQKYDRERQEYFFQERNIHTLRFSNDEVLQSLPKVLECIQQTIQKHSPPPSGEGLGERGKSGVAVGEGLGAGEKSVEEGLGVEESFGGGGKVVEEGVGLELTIEVPPELISSIQPKGSIAIDGVSLTVAGIEGSRIRIALIPLTRSETTFGTLTKGDRVNIETDILARRATMHS